MTTRFVKREAKITEQLRTLSGRRSGTVPSLNYIAVRGTGDPNQEDGEYKKSIGLLYGIAFTIKMSKKGDYRHPPA